KLEKHPFRPRPVRLTPSSRNSPAAGWFCLLLFVYDQGTLMGELFTIANVLPLIGLPLLRATRPPVASSPTHFQTLIGDVAPPVVESLASRRSAPWCGPVKG